MANYLRCAHLGCRRRATKIVGMEEDGNTFDGQTHDCCDEHCLVRLRTFGGESE